MRILLASDGSTQAARARDVLASLAIPEGSSIRVLTVLPAGPGHGDATPARPPGDAADGEIAAFAEPLRVVGCDVIADAVAGRPSTMILAQADRFEADLIVVGSHGRGALGTALLGSVAAEVVRAARCPVLVARTKEILRAVFADDGSTFASAARTALASGLFLGVSVVALSVWAARRPPVVNDVPRSARAAALRAYAAEGTRLRKEHEGIAARAASALRDAGLAATARVRDGAPSLEIMNEVRESHADLVVLGTVGRQGVVGATLGEVAHRVLSEASCSVLTAPRHALDPNR